MSDHRPLGAEADVDALIGVRFTAEDRAGLARGLTAHLGLTVDEADAVMAELLGQARA